MIDERTLPAPVMQAPSSMDCGLCAARYILRRFGLDADLETLRVETDWGTDERQGVYPHDIVRALLKRDGFEVMWPYQQHEAVGKMPHAGNLHRYKEWIDAGWVAVVNRHYVQRIGHYLVVDAIDSDGRLLVTCSLYGRRWWTAEEFFGGFDGKGDGHLWWLMRRTAGAH